MKDIVLAATKALKELEKDQKVEQKEDKKEEEIFNCPDCGYKLLPLSKYCPSCGVELDWEE